LTLGDLEQYYFKVIEIAVKYFKNYDRYSIVQTPSWLERYLIYKLFTQSRTNTKLK